MNVEHDEIESLESAIRMDINMDLLTGVISKRQRLAA